MLLNVWYFKCLAPKREREKRRKIRKERKIKENLKRHWLFKTPDSHFSLKKRGLLIVEAVQQWLSVSILRICTSVIRSSNQELEYRSLILGGRVLIIYPGSFKLYASCSWNTCTAACCGARDGRCNVATMKLTEIKYNLPSKSFPGNSLAFSWLKSYKIVMWDRSCQHNCCLGGEMES